MLSLPRLTNSWGILGAFIIFLVIFHVLFVRLSPLSSIQWKQIDYIWLTVAFFGIVGSVSENRAILAEKLLPRARDRFDFALSQVIAAANAGTSGAICRKFVITEASPPPEVMAQKQREFDAQCAWFKKVVEALKTRTKDSTSRIDVVQMAGPPPAGGFEEALKTRTKDSTRRIDVVQMAGPPPAGGFEDVYSQLEQSIAQYNETLEDIEKLELEKAKGGSDIELLFQVLGPLLIAFALALRITKVAGEVAIERARQSSKV
jgi:hypothetical protein